LEEEIDPVKRLLLVAPPRLDLELDTIKSFFPVEVPDFLFAQEALLVTSDDDPYMTLEEASALQEELDVEMKVLESAGHINADSGYGEWPWVKEWVLG
jgi:predicted alpha/beta hydrolase family esterase